MNNMNFTDWQDLWLKKDVEKISKKINSSPDFSLSIIIDLIIATLACAISAISIIEQSKKLIWIIISLAILSVVAPILIISTYRVKIYRKNIRNIHSKSLPVKEYVDIFDNKVCNSAMMADSLFKYMKSEDDVLTKYYCICEINYYINKCIDTLASMKNMSSQIFQNSNKKKNDRVSPERLRLVLKLLHKLRVLTYGEMRGIKDKDNIVEEYIINEIEIHDEKIIKFISQFNMKIEQQLKNDINPMLSKWTKCYKKTTSQSIQAK